MYQLVNLYQPVFRQQPKILSAVTIMTIIGIVMVLMFALYFKAQSSLKGLQSTSADLALNYTHLNARLGAVTSIAETPTDESVSEEIMTLQAQIDDRNALLEQIDSLFADSDVGFGEVFETLAQTNLPGLWLTGIQLSAVGGIRISGSAIDPKLVPRYLQLITQRSSLTSLSNGTVDLIRDDSRESQVDFVLSYNSSGEQQ